MLVGVRVATILGIAYGVAEWKLLLKAQTRWAANACTRSIYRRWLRNEHLF